VIAADGRPVCRERARAPAGSLEASAKRWQQEFKAAKESSSPGHDTAEDCDRRYRDEQRTNDEGDTLNLYAAGIDLKEATLPSDAPTVDVKRRYNDQDDDDARVAAELLERCLTATCSETRRSSEGRRIRQARLVDRGLGDVWFRYEQYEDEVSGQRTRSLEPTGRGKPPAVPASTQALTRTCAATTCTEGHAAPPCRVFSDMRWRARLRLLSKKSFEKKFGTDEMPPFAIGGCGRGQAHPKTPWARVGVGDLGEGSEVRLVPCSGPPAPCWSVGRPGLANPDGSIPDPLGIPGFLAVPGTDRRRRDEQQVRPPASYARSQDQYRAIDDETTRIGILRDAVSVRGVYDQTVGELAGLLDNKADNKMVPATNYKALAEKGGIAACVACVAAGGYYGSAAGVARSPAGRH